MYYRYNQATPPEEYAAAARRDREHQKLVNQFRAKDAAGRYIVKPLTKKEQRDENLLAGIMFFIVLPALFVLPALVFLAIIG